MRKFFNSGGADLHSFVASSMFGCEVSKKVNKDLRQKGKTTNFTISYGGGAHKIADAFQISVKEAKALIELFYEAFPALRSYFKVGHINALNKGYIFIDKYTGRKSYNKYWEKFQATKKLMDRWKSCGWKVPRQISSFYHRMKGIYERNSQNYPIQGTGSSMIKLAAIL